MFSIWKLVRSSSISGLSYVTNPNWPKISPISRMASMLGWSVPRAIGRPGVVTSTASAASCASRAEPRNAVPRSARAPSIAERTVFAIAPTRGRSSAGSAPMPRRTPVRRPFLPRTSSSIASMLATSGAASIAVSASSRSVSSSRVRSDRSTGILGPMRSRTARSDLGAGIARLQAVLARPVLGAGLPASGRLRELRDRSKRPGIANCQIRQDLAVDLDIGLLQAGDELAVRQAVLAGRCIDPDDPQLAHLALALLAIAGRIGKGVKERLTRRLDEARLGALPTLGVLVEALVTPVGRDAPFDSCHDVELLLEVREQATDLLRVLGSDERLPGVASGSSRRLDLEMVAAPGVDPDDLAAARHADALLGRLVTLDLGHPGLTLLSAPARVPVLLVLSMSVAEPVWRRPLGLLRLRPARPLHSTPVAPKPDRRAKSRQVPRRASPGLQAVRSEPLPEQLRRWSPPEPPEPLPAGLRPPRPRVRRVPWSVRRGSWACGAMPS